MPSSALAHIARQIEDQGVDHFSKFYMYAGLLNMISVRETDKTIFTVQPKTAPVLMSAKSLNHGVFGSNFANEVNQYQNYFQKPTPDPLMANKKIIMAYFRKGQLADLAYIIEQMVGHLTAHPLRPTDVDNLRIFESVQFAKKHAATIQFLRSVDELNKTLLGMVDNGVNSALSATVAVIGFSIMLASVFSLAGFIIGGALLVGGSLAAYNYSQHNVDVGARMELQFQTIITGATRMSSPCGFYESIFDETHKNFMIKGLIKPLAYGAVTLMEHAAPNEVTGEKVDGYRSNLEAGFRNI
jgi:hypothetical protein